MTAATRVPGLGWTPMPEYWDENIIGIMKCPWCGADQGVHVDKARITGDSTSKVALEIKGPREDNALPLSAQVVESTAPAKRRHTLSLSVRCENCGADGWVHLIQHKGDTFLSLEGPNLPGASEPDWGRIVTETRQDNESNTNKKEIDA